MSAADVATAPPGLRERKKQQMRQLIAETARRLFSERGFDRVTVAEIARVADVSEQTVFNYFPTKEDLVYWRMESFEGELLSAIRDRESGESVLSAFGRFVREPRGLLAKQDPEAREQLAALTRMITESGALRARERQIYDDYTRSLATLIAEEAGADASSAESWVAANAMIGAHRALVDYTRARIVAGARPPRLARDVATEAEKAFALLERGLGRYAIKDREPRRSQNDA
jgi:AcrR family transcriptional regulator